MSRNPRISIVAILCIEHWYDVNRDKDTTLLTLLYFTLHIRRNRLRGDYGKEEKCPAKT